MTVIRALTTRRAPLTACSTVALAAFGTLCAAPTGPARQIAGLSLVGALAFAVWLAQRSRFEAIVPTIGLCLAFLILTGLALAAVHVLSTVPVALVLTVATLAAAWVGASHPGSADLRPWLKPRHPLALAAILIFAAATILAVRYSAASATTDADGASSVAIWAYPSDGRLHVGIEQPAGQGATTLRIVVTRAGAIIATWTGIHLAPGQTWQAPALTVTGSGPVQVVALHGGTTVASLSSR